MKIRIKDNSIRLRLTKTDVQQLKNTHEVACKTIISPNQIFHYILRIDTSTNDLKASFDTSTITVALSIEQARILTDTDEITIIGSQPNGEADELFLLIEKDLQCLDPTDEDQSDMYQNTKTVC